MKKLFFICLVIAVIFGCTTYLFLNSELKPSEPGLLSVSTTTEVTQQPEAEDETSIVEKNGAVSCDGRGLLEQLEQILKQHKFDASRFDLVSNQSIMMPVRGRTNTSCTAQIKFSQSTTSIQVLGPESTALISSLDKAYVNVTINHNEYKLMSADGPLSSSMEYPLLAPDEKIQFLRVNSSAEIVPISFPESYSCPCAEVVTVTLTAPITP